MAINERETRREAEEAQRIAVEARDAEGRARRAEDALAHERLFANSRGER